MPLVTSAKEGLLTSRREQEEEVNESNPDFFKLARNAGPRSC